MKVIYIDDNETLGELFSLTVKERFPDLEFSYFKCWGDVTGVNKSDILFADCHGVGLRAEVPCKVVTISGDCSSMPDILKPFSDRAIARVINSFKMISF